VEVRQWDLGKLDFLEEAAVLLSAYEFIDPGSLRPLKTQDMKAAWKKSKGPLRDHFRADADKVWHEREARKAEASDDQWQAAVFHLGPALTPMPRTPAAWISPRHGSRR
jgi:hypothetical protein